MVRPTAAKFLEIARRHLVRVQAAWDAPTDWADLTIYSLYCPEAAVMAAAAHLHWDAKATHPSKAEVAERLHKEKGLPDISGLLPALNNARKAEAYGDVPRPNLAPEDIGIEVEQYVEAVEKLLSAKPRDHKKGR